MRPIRITGVTGTSSWVPLETYSAGQASVMLSAGTGTVDYTDDNVFDTSITPTAKPVTLTALAGVVPPGARAVRGVGLAPSDILTVSQQGII